MNSNARYGQLVLGYPALRYAVAALAALGVLLSVAMILLLNVSWIDVGLGLLVSMGLSVPMGFIVGMVVSKFSLENQYMEHADKVGLVLGIVPTIAGLAIFAGLSAALLIVLTPTLVTVPMSYGLRAWALRHYG